MKKLTVFGFIPPNKYATKDVIIYNPNTYNFKVLTSIFRFYRNRNFKIVKES